MVTHDPELAARAHRARSTSLDGRMLDLERIAPLPFEPLAERTPPAAG